MSPTRPATLASACAAALALPPVAVALGFWVAAEEGAGRVLSLAVAAVLAVGVHLVVRLGAPGRVRPREVMVLAALSGGLLTSFAVALALAGSTLNTALYEVSRADVGLAALVVLVLAGVALGHAVAAGRAARSDRRTRSSSRPQPRFAGQRAGGDRGPSAEVSRPSGSADLRP